MGNPPFEDVSPIKNGGVPYAMLVYRRVLSQELWKWKRNPFLFEDKLPTVFVWMRHECICEDCCWIGFVHQKQLVLCHSLDSVKYKYIYIYIQHVFFILATLYKVTIVLGGFFNSHIFWFSPWSLGFMIQFHGCIFFKGVETQPPTRIPLL